METSSTRGDALGVAATPCAECKNGAGIDFVAPHP
jgi:hypothetical protein